VRGLGPITTIFVPPKENLVLTVENQTILRKSVVVLARLVSVNKRIEGLRKNTTKTKFTRFMANHPAVKAVARMNSFLL
jgi:hypothetical protein